MQAFGGLQCPFCDRLVMRPSPCDNCKEGWIKYTGNRMFSCHDFCASFKNWWYNHRIYVGVTSYYYEEERRET